MLKKEELEEAIHSMEASLQALGKFRRHRCGAEGPQRTEVRQRRPAYDGNAREVVYFHASPEIPHPAPTAPAARQHHDFVPQTHEVFR